jgi:hypothetical protein
LIPTGAIEQAWQRLNAEVQELKEIATEVHDLRDTLHIAQQNVNGAFGKVAEKAISAECRLRYALERITNRLAEELFGLPRTTKAIAVVPPSDPDAVLAFIASLRNGKDARLRVFEAVYDLTQRLRGRERLPGVLLPLVGVAGALWLGAPFSLVEITHDHSIQMPDLR